MGGRESESFEAKVRTVAAANYPDGIPAPPSWFPVEVLEELSPASALLVQMVAAEGNHPIDPLNRVRWELTFLWIGLETGNQDRVDFCLDCILGTSGRGWLARRMKMMGLDTAEVEHELHLLCFDLIYQFADKKTSVDEGSRAYGYFRNAFRNRLESRLTELKAERHTSPPPRPEMSDPTGPPEPEIHIGPPADESTDPRRGFTAEDSLTLRLLVGRADLTQREVEALALRLQGLEGQGLADALGVQPKTAQTLEQRALKKIRDAL